MDLCHTSELRETSQPVIPGNLSVPTFQRVSTKRKVSLIPVSLVPEYGDSELDEYVEIPVDDDLEEGEDGDGASAPSASNEV
jgi:hypothetical protein